MAPINGNGLAAQGSCVLKHLITSGFTRMPGACSVFYEQHTKYEMGACNSVAEPAGQKEVTYLALPAQ